MMTDIQSLDPSAQDTEFVRWMIENVGVSAVPGSSFYAPRQRGRTKVRFMFSKRDEVLHEAGRRLLELPKRLAARGPGP